MVIYVVQPGDSISSIANAYGITESKLILDNGIRNPYSLVPGQTIVIAIPDQEYTVQEGDTLGSIAQANGITLMQLLRNNPYLNLRTNIFPGETLVIRYPTIGKIFTNGYCYPFVSVESLKYTLPSLTYLSIYNYKADKKGQVIAYEDDTAIIQLAKDYGVVPLMMIATLTQRGEPDTEVAYEILLNEEYQAILISNFINIIREKGYSGVNMVFSYINATNQSLYINLVSNVSKAMREAGFQFVITFNPTLLEITDIPSVDYTEFNKLVDGVIFAKFVWASNTGPPAPVSSNLYTTEFVKYMINFIPSYKIEAGIPIIGYEWELPYIKGQSTAKSLTIDSAISLANDTQSTIFFDEVSQTPYFEYYDFNYPTPSKFIVWFTDARSIQALLQVISDFELNGIGIWNIMVYYAQLWLLLNSQFEVVKLVPDHLS